MSEQGTSFTYDGYAIFEAMGHIRRIGKVRTSDLGGNAVFVVESQDPEGQTLTEIFAASALFRLTPVSQQVVEQTSRAVNPSPINPYELPGRVRRALLMIEQEDRDKASSIGAGHADDDPPFPSEGEEWEDAF